jgi:EAL domain-containing protein (putative c-di-GMP-specific phosphodiesterase class I)
VASCVEAFGDRSLILEVLETSVLSTAQLAVLRDWAAAGALLVVDDYGVAHADAVRVGTPADSAF